MLGQGHNNWKVILVKYDFERTIPNTENIRVIEVIEKTLEEGGATAETSSFLLKTKHIR